MSKKFKKPNPSIPIFIRRSQQHELTRITDNNRQHGNNAIYPKRSIISRLITTTLKQQQHTIYPKQLSAIIFFFSNVLVAERRIFSIKSGCQNLFAAIGFKNIAEQTRIKCQVLKDRDAKLYLFFIV